jgi:DNA-directed RNA polymerase specialized sigma24 family protein
MTVQETLCREPRAGVVPERLVALTEGEGGPLREVRRWLDRLPPSARPCLQVASLLDRAFTAEELGTLTGSPPGEIDAVMDEAVSAGILYRRGTLLDFRQDLIRRAISETLPAALRRSLRRQAVDVHMARGGRAVDVAAEIIQLSPANVRQLVSRARKHLNTTRRESIDTDEHRRLLFTFLEAAKGNVRALEDLFAAEAITTSARPSCLAQT